MNLKMMIENQPDPPKKATSPLFFWNPWRAPYKQAYLTGLLVLAAVLVLYLLSFWKGVEVAIPWQKNAQLQAVPFTLETFTQGLFNFPVEANSYVVTEKFEPAPFQLQVWTGGIWLAVTVASLLVLLTSVTFLPRLWFAIGMTAFVGVLVSFRLENLQLFGFANQLGLGLALFLFLPVAWYFQEINRRTPFLGRLGIFAGLAVLYGLLVVFFAKTSHPVVYLSGYGVLAPLVLTLFFILLVAHENIMAFVNIASLSGSKQGFLHFSLLCLIYLTYLVLSYLKNRLLIDWNILYINAFVVLAVSGVVGVWGWRRQSRYFTTVLPFFSQGAFFYLGLAILSFATIAFFFVTANDPMLEMLEDFILYTHIGLGVAFFFYVAANFFGPFSMGLPVIRIIYEPNRISTFIVRGIGIIIGILMFQVAERLPLYQAYAGYDNHLGDLYLHEKEYVLAEAYYKSALSQTGVLENHKSNYALFSLATAVGREDGQDFYLKQALLKNPVPQTYAALSSLMSRQNKFFEALFALQDGIRRFPQQGELYNNLGLLYATKSVTDSANFYFDKAGKYFSDKDFIQSNRLATALISKNLPQKLLADTLVQEQDYLPLKANKFALLNLAGKKAVEQKLFLPADSLLTLDNFASWFNYGLNQKTQPDTVFFKRVKAVAKASSNTLFEDDLTFMRVYHAYLNGDKMLAFNLLSIVQNRSVTQSAYFSRVLGLWFSRNGAYQRAIEYFDKALAAGDTLSYLNRSIALAEMGNPEIALGSLQQQKLNDPAALNFQKVLQAILDKNRPAAVASLDEAERVFFIHFTKDTTLSVSQNLSNIKLKALAFLEVAQQLYVNNKFANSISVLEKAKKIQGLDSITHRKIELLVLKNLLFMPGNKTAFPALESQIKKLAYTNSLFDEGYFLQAVWSEKSAHPEQVAALYKTAVNQHPLSEEVLTNAARFMAQQRNKPEEAYTILLNGIQLNPYSSTLYKAFILQALDLSMFSYAETGLQDLKRLLNAADYQAFIQVYQTKKALMQKAREGFQ